MRKRKQFNSLVRFNLTKTNSNDVLRTSEDELFIPDRKKPNNKLRPRSRNVSHYCKYFQHILSFIFILTFVIVCFGLTYTNMELKNEVENLSSRISQIENKSLYVELKDSLTIIEQIKTRLNFIEKWNLSFVYDQLQKLQLQNLNEETTVKLRNIMNESITRSYERLNSFKNEIKNLSQSIKIEDFISHFEQLSNIFYNSSTKTFIMLNGFQSDVDKLKVKMNECQCAKDVDSSPMEVSRTPLETMNDNNKEIENMKND